MAAEDMNYSDAYESYARTQAKYYSSAKFSREVPWGFRNETREKLILQLVKSVRPGSFLDLGCASGHTTLKVASAFPDMQVVGVDIGSAFITEAKRVALHNQVFNVSFTSSNAIDFVHSQADGFDCILAAEIIEHVLDLNEFCSSISKLQNRGGVVIFTTPNYNGDGTLVGRWGRLLKFRQFTPATDFTQSGVDSHGDQHVREFSIATLTEELRINGYRVLDFRGLIVLELPFNDFLYKFIRRVPGLLSIMQEFELWFSRRFKRIAAILGKQLLVIAQFNEQRF